MVRLRRRVRGVRVAQRLSCKARAAPAQVSLAKRRSRSSSNSHGARSSASKTANLSSCAVERQRDRGPSPAIPLLIMVLGLVITTIWFVALPTLNQPAPTKRACEVIVLKSDKTLAAAAVAIWALVLVSR